MSKEDQNLSILILEDDIDLAGQWIRTFSSKGMTVYHALTVDEAVIYCNQTKIDAIVLDIFLKDSTGKLMARAGITLLSYLRNPSLEKVPEWGKTVPIVVVTGAEAKLGYDPLSNARAIGGNWGISVLRKPFTPKILYAILMDMVKEYESK